MVDQGIRQPETSGKKIEIAALGTRIGLDGQP
jgi:hypothetical protein